jgi:hypothetical protein
VASLKSGAYDTMTNDELYRLVLNNGYNFLLSNCLLLLVKILDFEDRRSERLLERGHTRLQQGDQRDVRDLRRNVEKRCNEFLRSLRAPGVPYQVEKGEKGIFTSAGLEQSLLPLTPFAHQAGFHYNLRHSFLELVRALNGACTYQGRDVYVFDPTFIAWAFKIAAGQFERALALHAAGRPTQVSQEDLAFSSLFSSLNMNDNSPPTRYAVRPAYSQTSTALASSSVYPQPPPVTPPRRLHTTTALPPPSQAGAWSPPPAPRYSIASPIRSPQSAISSPYRSVSTCTVCSQTGHTSKSCPNTKCYRCKCPRTECGSLMSRFGSSNYYYNAEHTNSLCLVEQLGNGFGHMSFDCPINPSTPQRRR